MKLFKRYRVIEKNKHFYIQRFSFLFLEWRTYGDGFWWDSVRDGEIFSSVKEAEEELEYIKNKFKIIKYL